MSSGWLTGARKTGGDCQLHESCAWMSAKAEAALRAMPGPSMAEDGCSTEARHAVMGLLVLPPCW